MRPALKVVGMNYFRHAPLLAWTLVVLALACLGVVGWVVTAQGQYPAQALASDASYSKPNVELVIAKASGVHSAALAGRSQEWAAGYLEDVQAAKESVAEADPDDETLVLWEDLERAATKLASYRGSDKITSQALATEIGVAAGALAAGSRLR